MKILFILMVLLFSAAISRENPQGEYAYIYQDLDKKLTAQYK